MKLVSFLSLLYSVFLLSACAGDPFASAPVADAGADIQANARSQAQLNGGKSTSGAYNWKQISGPAVVAVAESDWHSAVFRFQVPAINITEPLVFQLTVTDASDVSSTDQVVVNRVATCDQKPGWVYDECLDNFWLTLGAFEFIEQPASNGDYTDLNAGRHIHWKEVDTQELDHHKVLDITFSNQENANGLFHILPHSGTLDMQDYAGGTLEFDIRVLDYGSNLSGIGTKIECIFPCQSAELLLPLAPINQWQSIKLSVDNLVARGLDLSKVK